MFEKRDFLPHICVGTLWEDEELETNHNYNNRWARDEKGHKRWHGAWTGGFEAGYRNTVGSAEGWVPGQFYSSRDKRNNKHQQSVLDFMDDEDLGSNVAGVNIVTQDNVSSFGVAKTAGKSFGKVVEDVPTEFFTIKDDSIGLKILNNLNEAKKSQYSDIKDAIEEAKDNMLAGYTNLPEDQPYLPLTKISTLHKGHSGIGFSKLIEGMTVDDRLEHEFKRIVSNLRKDLTNDQNAQKDSNMLFASDLDDSVDPLENLRYSKVEVSTEDDKGNVDFSKIEAECSAFRKIIDNFEEDIQPFAFAIPTNNSKDTKVPDDYNPYYRVTDHFKKKEERENQIKKGRELSIEERAKLLGEKEMLGPNPELAARTKKFMNKLSDKSKTLLMTNNKFVLSTAHSVTPENAEKIFENDQPKNERYYLFCLKKTGKYAYDIRYPLGFKASDIARENEEFEKIYKLLPPPPPLAPSEKNELDLKPRPQSRIVEDFIPDRILCIRFGVQQPKKSILRREKNQEQDVLKVVEEELQGSNFEWRPPQEKELDSSMLREEIPMPDENRIGWEAPPDELFDEIFNENEEDENDD